MELRTNTCPCCGKKNAVDGIGLYDICQNCGWEDDPIQRDDPDSLGINGKMTLNQAKKLIFEGKQIYEEFLPFK